MIGSSLQSLIAQLIIDTEKEGAEKESGSVMVDRGWD